MEWNKPEADKAVEVRAGEEIDKVRLNEYLQEELPGFTAISTIQQFGGGYSNLTYLINTKDTAYVLRRPPFGAKEIRGGHNMEREFSIISRLADAGFDKVPRPFLYCGDEEVIGSNFYVMSRVEGLILRTDDTEEIKRRFDKDQMNGLSKSLCRHLAGLHLIDIGSTGLVSIGKPEGYIKRQLEGWYNRYQASQTDDITAIDALAEWLLQHLPEEMKPSLIHNDYKFDNVVFDTETLEMKAILDWEMTTVGDPRMDIGTALSYWSENTDGDFEKSFNITWLPGNLSREEFVGYYQEENNIDLSNILYFYVFGLFKNAVVMQQIYARFKKGLTKDPRFGALIHGVRRLSEKGMLSVSEGRML